MPSEAVPVVTILVAGSVEDTFRPGWDNKLSRVLVWSGQKVRPTKVPYGIFAEVCRAANGALESASSAANRSAAVVRAHYRGQFSTVLDSVSEHDKYDIQAMVEGRAKLIFLINTPGGCVSAEKKLVRYADRVRKNGGEVWAFGQKKVSSAGATIFMHADSERRILEENTSLYFHLSTAAKRDESLTISDLQMEGNRWDEVVAMKRLFVGACLDSCYATYLERMVDSLSSKTPLGKDLEWRFSAKEAQQLWKVAPRTVQMFRSSYASIFEDDSSAQTFLASREASGINKFLEHHL